MELTYDDATFYNRNLLSGERQSFITIEKANEIWKHRLSESINVGYVLPNNLKGGISEMKNGFDTEYTHRIYYITEPIEPEKVECEADHEAMVKAAQIYEALGMPIPTIICSCGQQLNGDENNGI
jgi:hypothetical protein